MLICAHLCCISLNWLCQVCYPIAVLSFVFCIFQTHKPFYLYYFPGSLVNPGVNSVEDRVTLLNTTLGWKVDMNGQRLILECVEKCIFQMHKPFFLSLLLSGSSA
jgi:hypothetical protein